MTKTTPETKVYSHEQAIKDSLEYFNGDELAANVFVTKYAVRNLKGELIENTPVAMHRRMAKEFARIEKTYSHSADFRYSEYGQKRSFLTEEKIFSYFDKFKYIVPQGSPMSVLGNPFAIASLSNCIVIPELFDSYGGICFADQQLAILMKRRCVEENSFVDTKEKGIVPIKEIKIGMHVLSYDISKQTTTYKKVLNRFETEVETDNRIKLTLSNGSVLKTSKKHPILVRRGTEYMYINGGELQINDICVKPEFRHSLSNNFSINDQDLTDIGWLLGVHMGDGSCIDYKKTQQYNFRISGDNENVVKEYARVFNAFTNKKNIYKVSTRKDYSVPVWEYYATLSHEKGKVFLDKYLDNQYGKKTYTGKTPSFIKENNLWIPYIAGLIDADGAIREKGSAVCLALCTKTIIDEIATFLTSHGISCKVSTYVPKKSNEQIRYQLYIHSSRLFWNILSPYLRHEVKRTKLENHSVREYSQRLPITSQELQEFERRYQDTPKKPNDLAAVMYLSRKNGIMGKASLNQLVTKDILSEKEQQSILQRVQIVNIETDTESTKYIDIEVEHTNNFYAGNNGMICIHNCGVGVDISELRPSGASVTNAGATSSGAISFMERFSSTTREVAQNGRRGALMITIDIAHPDVEAFVLSKQDLTKVTGANISIRLSDEFMKAVRDDKEYTHRWPIESKTPKYTKTVNARKLWEVIIKAAHNTAEPGLIFWDRQHHYSTSSVYPEFKNTSTNPCLTGDTWITTVDGPKQIKDLVNVPTKLLLDGKFYDTTDVGFWSTGTKKVFEIQLKNGLKIQATENHQFLTDEEWLRVDQLTISRKLLIGKNENVEWKGTGGSKEEGWLIGNLIGDGTWADNNSVKFSYWTENRFEMEKIAIDLLSKTVREPKINKKYGNRGNSENPSHKNVSVYSSRFAENAKKWNVIRGDKHINSTIERGSSDFYRGVIGGFFDADGSVWGDNMLGLNVSFGQSHKESLEILQRMLLRLGIESNFIVMNAEQHMMLLPDGRGGQKEYSCAPNFELRISGRFMVKKFFEIIDVRDTLKLERFRVRESAYSKAPYLRRNMYSSPIESITYVGEKEVFDCTVPETSAFDANGFISHNCSEIAMQGGDSCRLIALNLFGCVDNPFTPQAKFNFEKFYEVTYEAQRLMDDLVELEIEAIQRILDKVNSDDEPDYIKDTEVRTWKLLLETGKKGRRTGLGFTAFADALAALGFGYDSEEGLKVTEEIMKTKLRAEFDSSIDMAIERGAFEGFNTRYENDSDFVQMLKEEFPEIASRMMVYGRRNISISTVAPTGSLSIIAQSSSGMEPVFMLSYKRRKKIMTSNVDVKVDFVDSLGDKWQEFDVYHTKLKMWMDVTGETDITKSPYFGSTAPEIDWIKRVEIQALIQKYITHSISSTINLPNDVSLEKVSEIYMESWKQGLKGITVYRDGSRSGVLVSKDEKKKEEYKETHAPKRPEALDCDIIRFVNDREKWIGFVGLLGEAPYEVFTGKADEITIPLSVIRGKMVRVKKGDVSSYNFHYIQGEKEIVVEQINRAFDKHYWNYAKLISGVLRHGMPLPFVVDTIASLNLEDALITTWKNGVGRMIKRYIKDGTVAGDKKCKDCGAESVIYQEGCLVCNSCGSSKCG